MSAVTVTLFAAYPAPEGRVKSDPDDNHLYCCNPDVSLCGLDIRDGDDLDFTDEECCPTCLSLVESACHPGCPDAEQDGGVA